MVGAGAIGSSIAGWVAPHYENLWLLARGESADAIRAEGLRFYLKGQEASTAPVKVKVIESLGEIESPDAVLVAVKNYDLKSTAKMLRKELGTHQPVVVGLQNGVENQQVLPKYFDKVAYGVVCFNAWRDGPGRVGHQKHGYVIVGTPNNTLMPEQQQIASILRLGLECRVTDRLEDAVHCKLAVNLTNALNALIGADKCPVTDPSATAKLSSKLIWEGIKVLKAAGFREHELGSISSWNTIRAGTMLPNSLLKILYRFRVKEDLGLNSTQQDVFAGKSVTELDSLNGYMLSLAKKTGVSMPINQAVYEIAKERFGKKFEPICEKELCAEIDRISKR